MRISWHRLVAMLLLLWAAIDVCAPQLCAAENVSMPAAAQQTSIGTCRGGQNPQSDNGDGDCFCCCTHVVANTQFQIAGLVQSAPQECRLLLPHSEDSSRVLYPPPRS